jgi:hypothetical protein
MVVKGESMARQYTGPEKMSIVDFCKKPYWALDIFRKS